MYKELVDEHSKRVVVTGCMPRERLVLISFPQGSVLQVVFFGIFSNDRKSEIGWTLCKFADDTKLTGEVDKTERSDETQRDLDKLEVQACKKLMEINKSKCKILHLGPGSPRHKYRLGKKVIGISPVRKNLGILDGEEQDMSQDCVLSTKRASVLG